MLADGRAHNETWMYYPDDTPLRSMYAGDSRAALMPFLAHKVFGATYKWVLYGDDDTIFFIDTILRLLQDFDEHLPYFITGMQSAPDSIIMLLCCAMVTCCFVVVAPQSHTLDYMLPTPLVTLRTDARHSSSTSKSTPTRYRSFLVDRRSQPPLPPQQGRSPLPAMPLPTTPGHRPLTSPRHCAIRLPMHAAAAV